jgi:hypothetical protein
VELGEKKDTQRFPHFSLECIEPLPAARVQHHILAWIKVELDMIIEEDGENQAYGLLLSLKVDCTVLVL